MKILYFDTETTGTNPIKHDVIQLAGMVEIDGEIKEKFNFTCQPISYENIDPEALKVHGMGIEKLKTYQSPRNMLTEFTKMLSKYVDKYNRNDKFYPAGYNVRFDLDMVNQFMKKLGDQYGFGTWQNWQAIDPLPIFQFLKATGRINFPNCKLSTICEHYQIEINAHDALSDITATRAVIEKAKTLFN